MDVHWRARWPKPPPAPGTTIQSPALTLASFNALYTVTPAQTAKTPTVKLGG